VISDGQDETAGKATDRSKKWIWTKGGLDANGCVEFLNGTNRDQKVTFELSNPTQANAQGEALFNYKISSGDIADLKDSQTAGFGTQAETNSWLFWFWFIVLLFAGLAIPFGILRFINSKNARFTVGPGTFRGVIGLRLDRENQKLLVNNETGRLTDAQANLVFFGRTPNLDGTKTFDDGPVSATAKSPLWPLSAPQFLAVLDPTKTLIAGDLLGRFSRTSTSVQRLTYGRVSSLAFVTNDVSHNLFDDSNSFTSASAARLVLYVSNAYQDPSVYQEKISQILDDPELYNAVSSITPERAFTSNVAAIPDWDDSTSSSSSDTDADDWFNSDDSGFSSDSKTNDDF
jgi:hypothetical protein